MWDCFSCHASGFRLVLSDGTSICVNDLDDDWEAFRGILNRVYPDIDLEAVEKVEQTFPGEIELTCWNKKNEVSQQSGSSE